MKTGSRLWISSDEMSMNIEPNPNAQMPVGKARNVAGALEGRCELFEGGEFMRDVIAGCVRLKVSAASPSLRRVRLTAWLPVALPSQGEFRLCTRGPSRIAAK